MNFSKSQKQREPDTFRLCNKQACFVVKYWVCYRQVWQGLLCSQRSASMRSQWHPCDLHTWRFRTLSRPGWLLFTASTNSVASNEPQSLHRPWHVIFARKMLPSCIWSNARSGIQTPGLVQASAETGSETNETLINSYYAGAKQSALEIRSNFFFLHGSRKLERKLLLATDNCNCSQW